MAKVNAPLFGFGASGKLADSLVFFPWKGLNVVRSYVKPANPNTTPQQTQRGYVTAAVAKIHAAQATATHQLNSADQTAYAALAAALGITMTWFNAACKLWVDTNVAGKIPVIYRDFTTTTTTHTGADMTGYLSEKTGSTLAAGKIYLGTSKTNLNKTKAVVVTAGVSVTNAAAKFTDLVAGVKYFWQFRPDTGDGCEGANSGIYNFVAT